MVFAELTIATDTHTPTTLRQYFCIGKGCNYLMMRCSLLITMHILRSAPLLCVGLWRYLMGQRKKNEGPTCRYETLYTPVERTIKHGGFRVLKLFKAVSVLILFTTVPVAVASEVSHVQFTRQRRDETVLTRRVGRCELGFGVIVLTYALLFSCRRLSKIFSKFKRGHPQRGRQMQVG